MQIVKDIPLKLDAAAISKRLHVKQPAEHSRIHDLVDKASPLIEPRAAYRVCYIDAKLEDGIILDGQRLTSAVLRRNLDPVQRVFPYVVTIGGKLEQSARQSGDLLTQFYLDAIANAALTAARRFVKSHLQSRFALQGMSSMAPGSLGDWPIQEQKPLFALLGDVQAAIGVSLTESLLMLPAKSISGILFPTEVPFYSCQLCPRQNCDARRAPYDKKQAAKYETSN